jgi:hypothetical protein
MKIMVTGTILGALAAQIAGGLDQCIRDCMDYNTVKEKQCDGTGNGQELDPNVPVPTPRACILNYPEICAVKCKNGIPF